MNTNSNSYTIIYASIMVVIVAFLLLGKADNGQGDGIMCIAHLTKAIVLKDDFIEARLLLSLIHI